MSQNIPQEALEAIFKNCMDITETLNKIEKDGFTRKEVFDKIGMNEQTYYSWVKKNPQLIQIIHDGYVMAEIRNKLDQVHTIVDSYVRSQRAEEIVAEILQGLRDDSPRGD